MSDDTQQAEAPAPAEPTAYELVTSVVTEPGTGRRVPSVEVAPALVWISDEVHKLLVADDPAPDQLAKDWTPVYSFGTAGLGVGVVRYRYDGGTVHTSTGATAHVYARQP